VFHFTLSCCRVVIRLFSFPQRPKPVGNRRSAIWQHLLLPPTRFLFIRCLCKSKAAVGESNRRSPIYFN
jgi:hypothetical protein